MGLLSRSAGYCYCLHCDGCIWEFPHNLPSLDIFNCIPPISLLLGIGLCSRLCFRLVIVRGVYELSYFPFVLLGMGVCLLSNDYLKPQEYY